MLKLISKDRHPCMVEKILSYQSSYKLPEPQQAYHAACNTIVARDVGLVFSSNL